MWFGPQFKRRLSMAKCIQNVKSLEIRRVDDDEAFRMTFYEQLLGPWKYIPKKVWKRFVRHPEKTVDKVE